MENVFEINGSGRIVYKNPKGCSIFILFSDESGGLGIRYYGQAGDDFSSDQINLTIDDIKSFLTTLHSAVADKSGGGVHILDNSRYGILIDGGNVSVGVRIKKYNGGGSSTYKMSRDDLVTLYETIKDYSEIRNLNLIVV